ncbi:ABC transporter ATP-binding protein [Pelagicoccus sp. SDUM812003]|uniref:ABC transporter ATP-binding protein n=1 Tax=Pelagicoccus sp. SDUM812003 TaxID=3041267 RepID=UPI00280FED97|nr:ABC transporter ATP-binding protein [Pelagicoccus sp. SDUM812003]MDQ8205415.1 ABC transporter ATP-binding protein [Pelagicoccus sp. SDUM812003]
MSAVIEIKGLTKDFSLSEKGRYLRAVDHLDLTIERNSVFGLLGPNGSGKSTTIKILLGLSQPTSGSCRILGNAPSDRLTRSKVGYLPDAPYYYRFLSGLELMLFYAKLLGVPRCRRESRCRELLRDFGLSDAASRKVGAYSKGMLQRLGFAQSLIGDPEILILDEPTAGVDPVGAAEVGDFIRRLKAEGKSILLCSHLLAQVQDVCDRVGIMNKGRLLAEGSLDELLATGDRTSLRIEGIDAETSKELERRATAAGGKVTPQGISLDALFRDLVENDEERESEA